MTDGKAAEKEEVLKEWVPRTELGKLVLSGKIKSLEEILLSNRKIMEPEIVDYLEPDMQTMVIDVKKTARVVRAGRKFSFRAAVLIGNKKGIIGIGMAKDREKWPAVRKAEKNAKLNLILVKRGCGSWECGCNEEHSVPFQVTGKCASVRVTLIPAPKGAGLVVGNKIKPVMEFAGIKDVWSKTKGNTSTTLNFVRAAIDALRRTLKVKQSPDMERKIVKVTK